MAHVERRPQVVVVALEVVEPGALVRALEQRRGLLGEGQEDRGVGGRGRPRPRWMRPASRRRTRGSSRTCRSEGSRRAPRRGGRGSGRPGRRARPACRWAPRRRPGPPATGLGRLQVPAAPEDGEAGQQPSLRARRAGRSSRRSRRAASAGGRAGREPSTVSRPSWRSRRSRIWSGERSLTRAAASSMASGMPWSRAQMPATAGAFSLVTWKSGRTATARAMKSRTASYCSSVTGSGWRRPAGRFSSSTRERRLVSGGAGRPGTTYSCSPEIRRTARLVTTRRTPGQARSRSPMSPAASMTCSKLSSTRSIRRWPTAATRVSRAFSPGRWKAPSVRAMAGRTSVASRSGSSATNQTPSG